ncbi:hypothetical protein J2Z21_009083 [Streptomyces griseochromogenes]|uniref:Thioesterase domain-containing protein n=1 Tax=Streptomyces griseochromogenes TaxID=68214 RepID=A0ABS4M8R2_9ACTN|nr:hypothetical protein [Streptomyces griseochromogenes]MBP2056066.1 hypothetical protein [Streptomyces griseochromogenes]
MPNEGSWSVISTPKSNRIILAVDFPAAGRREAGFGDLAAKVGPAWSDYGFLQTTPPSVRLSERPSGDFYTEHWIRGGEWEKYEVVAVLGYCVGSVYAAELAQRLTRWQSTEPKVILFDPQLTDSQLLAMEMHKMIGMAGPLFSDEEAERARQSATAIIETHAGGLVDAAIEIVGLYREMATIAFKRLGLADSRRDEVVLLFESYMTWLSAAAQVDPSTVWRRSTAITSTDWAAMESRGDTTVLNASKVIGRKFPVDIDHADLMRTDSAVQILLDEGEF